MTLPRAWNLEQGKCIVAIHEEVDQRIEGGTEVSIATDTEGDASEPGPNEENVMVNLKNKQRRRRRNTYAFENLSDATTKYHLKRVLRVCVCEESD